MGEATYYCKIHFKTVEEAKKSFFPIKDFFEEGYNAYEYWQDNRGVEEIKFWKEFKDQFTVVTEYLKYINCYGVGKDHDNGLAGKLDFMGDKEDIDNFELNDKVISYFSTVWHFADWDYLSNFIEDKWNCRFRWISDEYANLLDHKDLDL